jgi:hypothetical protein
MQYGRKWKILTGKYAVAFGYCAEDFNCDYRLIEKYVFKQTISNRKGKKKCGRASYILFDLTVRWYLA